LITNDHNTSKNSKTKNEKVVTGTPKNLMVPVLLLSLRSWNLHGYKLIQQLTQFGFASIDQGNVYRTLRQLEKDNMVKSEWDTSEGGPAKRIYSLTEAGEKYLDTWANSLEHYQSMLSRFFSMYTDMMMPSNFERQSDDNER
jgi:PadR family transcriptional regulator, regulatory protein PadR